MRNSYRSSVRAPIQTLINAADAVLPGHRRLSGELVRRSLWGALPSAPAARPDTVNRLAITVDLDYQKDTDVLVRLVDLMGRCGAPLSVAAVGALVEVDPGPYAYALAAGHEIVNHSMTHPDNPVLNPDEEFWNLTTSRIREEIGQAQQVYEERLGIRPVGFRTPHFKDTHKMLSVLSEFDEIRYLSSVLANTSPLGAEPYFPSAADQTWGQQLSATEVDDRVEVLQLPLTACPSHRWSPFCSWHGIREGGGQGSGMHSLVEWEALWTRMLTQRAADGLAVVYFDPHDLLRDADTEAAFERMVQHAMRSGWELESMADIAEVYRGLATSPGRTGVSA